MKITKEIWDCGILMKVKEFDSVEAAVMDATQSSTELTELLARFVECVYGEANGKAESIKYILGYGYEVEE
jgi:hypothetical protein